MKSFRALTLMDTVIAMVLASLVLGMGGTFYLGLVRSIEQYHLTGEEVAQYQQLLFLLRHDFDRSKSIYAHENGFMLMDQDGKPIATFDFNEQHVIRLQAEHKDTLKLQVRESNFQYQHQSLTANGLIDHVVLDLKSVKTSQRMEWKKEYSASMRINSDFLGH